MDILTTQFILKQPLKVWSLSIALGGSESFFCNDNIDLISPKAL